MGVEKYFENKRSMLDGIILDEMAAGKTPVEISKIVGVSPAEVLKRGNVLLNSEIVTDKEDMRKLQIYRLNKLINALWDRVQQQADRDDVKNLVEILDRISNLLALNESAQAEVNEKMFQYQAAMYMMMMQQMLEAFKQLAPDALPTEAAWSEWTEKQIEAAEQVLDAEEE